MAYEESELRRTLKDRIYRQAAVPGTIRSGGQGAPGNRNQGPVEDISSGVGLIGMGLMGFALTGGDAGGFQTNPGA